MHTPLETLFNANVFDALRIPASSRPQAIVALVEERRADASQRGEAYLPHVIGDLAPVLADPIAIDECRLTAGWRADPRLASWAPKHDQNLERLRTLRGLKGATGTVRTRSLRSWLVGTYPTEVWEALGRPFGSLDVYRAVCANVAVLAVASYYEEDMREELNAGKVASVLLKHQDLDLAPFVLAGENEIADRGTALISALNVRTARADRQWLEDPIFWELGLFQAAIDDLLKAFREAPHRFPGGDLAVDHVLLLRVEVTRMLVEWLSARGHIGEAANVLQDALSRELSTTGLDVLESVRTHHLARGRHDLEEAESRSDEAAVESASARLRLFSDDADERKAANWATEVARREIWRHPEAQLQAALFGFEETRSAWQQRESEAARSRQSSLPAAEAREGMPGRCPTTEVVSRPPLVRLFGTGLTLDGPPELWFETNTGVATWNVKLLWLPVLPLRRYLACQAPRQELVLLERKPFRRQDWVHVAATLTLLAAAAAAAIVAR